MKIELWRRDGVRFPGQQIALMIVPATIAIAVLRYRLWDIDFAINRSLVYGSLTTILLTLFALSLRLISTLAPACKCR